ncbi:BON domain-containing protein [Azospirillum sp. HJ39]|uniref:BON domain-containing protein n=1 Tax=Azospirillum sp. HJ39 TaxID=3159496 RepID=UPI003555CC48
MAQYENRWRGEGRDWSEDDRDREGRWRREGQRYGVYDPGDGQPFADRDSMYRGQAHRHQDEQGRSYRDAGYGGRVGNESGDYGREPRYEGRRDMERVYDRSFGAGRDVNRGGYAGAGNAGTEGNYTSRDIGSGDYRSRDYGAGSHGERDYGAQGRGYGREPERERGGWYRGDAGPGYGPGYGRDDARFRGEDRNAPFRDRGYGGYGGERNDRGTASRDRGFWEQAGDEVASWFGDDDAERRRHEDERRAAQNRGRGPRGYSRSDERMREDINDRLTDDAYIDASDIEVAVSGGEATLTGMVPDRQTRRRAEDVAESVSGISHVQNNLRVRSRTDMQGGSDRGNSWGSSTGAGASAMAGAGSGTATGAVSSPSGSPAGAAAGLQGSGMGAGMGAGTSGGPAGASAGTGSNAGTSASTAGTAEASRSSSSRS